MTYRMEEVTLWNRHALPVYGIYFYSKRVPPQYSTKNNYTTAVVIVIMNFVLALLITVTKLHFY